MKNIILVKTISFAAATIFLCSANAAQKNLKSPIPHQAVKTNLNKLSIKPATLASANLQLPSFNNHRETVQFSSAISLNSAVLKQPKPVKAVSHEYWFNVSGSQLKRGVGVDTSGAEALIRISPKSNIDPFQQKTSQSKDQNSATAIDLELLEITVPDGRVFQGQNAMSFSANAKQLSSTEFSKGSTGFKLDKALSSGRFQLRTTQSIADKQQYTVYVLDKNSPFQLDLEMASQQILAGNRLSAKVYMSRSGKPTNLDRVSAKFVSPEGKVYSVKTKINSSGSFELDQALTMPFASHAGLWEMQIVSQARKGNLLVKRNSKLAFAYQPRTANLSQKSARTLRGKRGLTHTVEVSASHAGRYEATGLLYVVNKNGAKRVVAEARTAKWIEPGNQGITLLFKPSLLPKLKEGQHFEVLRIGLKDQSRMSVLE